MKARLTFLSGPHRGRRVIVTDESFTIGSDRAHTIHVSGPSAADPLARIDRRDASYWLTTPLPLGAVVVKGAATQDSALEDGDLLSLAGHTLRFSVAPDRRDECKPMRRILRNSWRAAASLDGGRIRRGLFLARDLCDCTRREARPAARFGSAATLALVAVAFIVASVSLFQARRASERVVELSARMAEGLVSRERLQQDVARLRQPAPEPSDTQARLGQVAEHLRAAEERLAQIERQEPALLGAIDAARQSVAFIVVGYALYESESGKPLRLVSGDAEAPQPDERERVLTSVDGAGPVAVSYVSGSGFLVGPDRLMTNRHVAEPWSDDESAIGAMRLGVVPTHTVVRAYFPGVRRPVDLLVAAVSEDADIAVLEGPVPPGRQPLKLAPASHAVRTGDPIVVVGYPTGLEALLAKLGEQAAQALIASVKNGHNPAQVADALARRHVIAPLVTMGHIGDVVEHNIVYDAATTYGGSGGPVLDASGAVIALNYAVLDNFAGAKFGIPIRFVHELLRPKRIGQTP